MDGCGCCADARRIVTILEAGRNWTAPILKLGVNCIEAISKAKVNCTAVCMEPGCGAPPGAEVRTTVGVWLGSGMIKDVVGCEITGSVKAVGRSKTGDSVIWRSSPTSIRCAFGSVMVSAV